MNRRKVHFIVFSVAAVGMCLWLTRDYQEHLFGNGTARRAHLDSLAAEKSFIQQSPVQFLKKRIVTIEQSEILNCAFELISDPTEASDGEVLFACVALTLLESGDKDTNAYRWISEEVYKVARERLSVNPSIAQSPEDNLRTLDRLQFDEMKMSELLESVLLDQSKPSAAQIGTRPNR